MPLRNVIIARKVSPTIAVAALAFAVQLGVVLRFGASSELVPNGDDMRFYADWGMRIANGALTDGKAFYGLPGYAYLLAAFFKVTGGAPHAAAGLVDVAFLAAGVQAALFAAVAGVVYRLATFAFEKGAPDDAAASGAKSSIAGWLAALGWIFFLPAQTFSVILMPTIWLVLAYWGGVLWLMRTRKSSWVKPWPLLGFLIGLVSMLVATILFLAPLVLFAIGRSVARGRPSKVRLLHATAAAALFVGGLFAGTAPAWIHNRFIAGEPVMLSAHSGINFWIGNNPAATGYPKMPPGIRASQQGLLRDSITLAETAAGRPLTRAEVSTYWSGRANAYIRENFSEWLALMGRKLANFWNAYPYDDISSLKLLRDQGVTWPGLGFGIVAALGLPGMFLACRRHAGARWVAAAVLLHMLALMPVFVTERYRLAAVPGLLVLGAWWLTALWEKIARRRWLGALPFVAAAAGAAWFVSIPRDDPSLWALDHYKAGIRATTAGDLDRAQRNLETALAYTPTSAEVQLAMGNLWLERGDRVKARAFYEAALALNPTHKGVLNNLGVLAFEEQSWEAAEGWFQRALAAESDDAKTHYMLARTRLARGDHAAAQAAIAEALRLRPEQREYQQFKNDLAAPPSR